MIKCINCNYYVDNNNGYEYCAYFCQPIDRIIILSMCKWIEDEENNSKNQNERDSEDL